MGRNDPDDEDDRPRRRPPDDFDDLPGGPRRSYDELDDFDDYPHRPRGDGLGLAAMIVGIISCVFALGCCIPYLNILLGPLSLVGAVTAIILGFVARSQNPRSGQATAGIITGFAALLLAVLLVVVAFVIGFGMAAMG